MSEIEKKRKKKGRVQPNRGKKKKKKGFPVFFTIYFTLIALAVFAVAFGMKYLRGYLAAYENSQPKYEAEKVAQTFLNRDFETLYEYEDQSLFEGETEQQYVDYMNELTSGMDITYKSVVSGSEDEMRYLVKADDVPLGEFTLKKNGQVDEYGFEGWTLDTMKTTGVLRSETYRVTAPTKSTVYVDGQALTDAEIIERDIPIFTVEDLPDGAHVPTDCVYEFTRYFGVDQVRVVDQYGEENALTEQGNTYTAAFNYDDSRLAPELEERVIQVVRRLSCFMTDDYSRSRLYKDLIEDSKAYSYVKRFDLNWIAKHKSYEFSNMQVNNYVSYSDDCFSAEVRYDYTIIYRKADPETYPTAYRLFFKKVKDEWYLYDFTLI